MNDVQARAMFRNKLNNRIKACAIKVVTLAKLTGASTSQVNRWADGHLMPTYREFTRLCQIFGVEDEYFLGNSTSEGSYVRRFKRGEG